jgi:hypothetical protein
LHNAPRAGGRARARRNSSTRGVLNHTLHYGQEMGVCQEASLYSTVLARENYIKK